MSESSSTGRALRALCDWFENIGLADLFACADQIHPRYEQWNRFREAAPGELRHAVEFALLGLAVRQDSLHRSPADAIDSLKRAGIIKSVGGDLISLGGLAILPVFGAWLITQVPQPNPTLYFGDDSVALAMRLRARDGDRALDLCCGPGIQSIRLAQLGAKVTAVEVNPVAATLARLNAEINGISSRMEVRIGDLYGPVSGEVFDVITANPPLLPIPDSIPYPFVGHGGSDGLTVVRRILNGLPLALKERGHARLLGTTLSDGYVPFVIEELDKWGREKGMSVTMYVTSHHSLADDSEFFEGLIGTCAGTGDIEKAQVRPKYRAFLESRGATHLCAYFLLIGFGQGEAKLIDVANDRTRDLWFV